jgi:putative colanic acid biosynthesis UDP-glucose lipid carrier transferase
MDIIWYQVVCWGMIAFFIRFTGFTLPTPLKLHQKLFSKVYFFVGNGSFFPFSKKLFLAEKLSLCLSLQFYYLLLFQNFLLFYYLKEYILTGSNYRNAIIIGYTPETIELKNL